MKYVKLFENWLNEAEADGSKALEELQKTTIGAFKKASDKGDFLKNIFAKAMQKDPSKFDSNAGSNLHVEVEYETPVRVSFLSEFFSWRDEDRDFSWGSKTARSKGTMEKSQETIKRVLKIDPTEVYGKDFSNIIASKGDSKKYLKFEQAEKLLSEIKKYSESSDSDFLKKFKKEEDKEIMLRTLESDARILEEKIKFFKEKYPDGKKTLVTLYPNGKDTEPEMTINMTKALKSSDNSDEKSLLDFACDSYNILSLDNVGEQQSYLNQFNVKPTVGMFMTFLQSYTQKGKADEMLLGSSAKKSYSDNLASIFVSSSGSAATAGAKIKKK